MAHHRDRKRPYYCQIDIEDDRYDIVQQLEDFESIKNCKKYNRRNIKALYAADEPKYHALARKIESCGRTPCNSKGCMVCGREYRRFLFHETSRLSDSFGEVHTCTLIPKYSFVDNEQIRTFTPIKSINRLRKQLCRESVPNPVIGSLEIDYHPDAEGWLPHFHLIIYGDCQHFKQVIDKYYQDQPVHESRAGIVNRPSRTDRVVNPSKQLSYCYKAYFKRIENYQDNHGRRKTAPYGLKNKQLVISLELMGRYGFNGFLFLYRVRRHGTKLVISN